MVKNRTRSRKPTPLAPAPLVSGWITRALFRGPEGPTERVVESRESFVPQSAFARGVARQVWMEAEQTPRSIRVHRAVVGASGRTGQDLRAREPCHGGAALRHATGATHLLHAGQGAVAARRALAGREERVGLAGPARTRSAAAAVAQLHIGGGAAGVRRGAHALRGGNDVDREAGVGARARGARAGVEAPGRGVRREVGGVATAAHEEREDDEQGTHDRTGKLGHDWLLLWVRSDPVSMTREKRVSLTRIYR